LKEGGDENFLNLKEITIESGDIPELPVLQSVLFTMFYCDNMISIFCVLQNMLLRLRLYLPYSRHDNGSLKQYKFVSGRPKTKDRFGDIGGAGKIMARGELIT
jgi:hypothetical protein